MVTHNVRRHLSFSVYSLSKNSNRCDYDEVLYRPRIAAEQWKARGRYTAGHSSPVKFTVFSVRLIGFAVNVANIDSLSCYLSSLIRLAISIACPTDLLKLMLMQRRIIMRQEQFNFRFHCLLPTEFYTRISTIRYL